MTPRISLCYLLLLCAAVLPAQDFVANINDAGAGSEPRHLVTTPGHAVWAATDGTTRQHVFVYDERAGTTTRVELPGPNSQAVLRMAVTPEFAVFTVSAALAPVRLLTLRLEDKRIAEITIEGLDAPRLGTPWMQDGELILTVVDDDEIRVLAGDGTDAGTRLIQTLPKSPTLRTPSVALLENALFLYYNSPSGIALRRIDLRGGQTEVVWSDYPRTLTSAPLYAAGGRLYFQGTDDDVYVTDAPAGPARRIYGSDTPAAFSGAPTGVYTYRDTALLLTAGGDVYALDPVTSAPSLYFSFADDLSPRAETFVFDEDGAYFLEGFFFHPALYRTDFTTAGTRRVTQTRQNYGHAGRPRRTASGDLYFLNRFRNLQVISSAEPYAFRPAYDSVATLPATILEPLAVTDSAAYLRGFTPRYGEEIYRFADGDGGITTDVNTARTGSSPRAATVINDRLVFFAFTDCAGYEPYAFTTGDSTYLLGDLRPGDASSFHLATARGGNALYYTDGSNLRAIYRTDGTPGGTSKVLDLSGAQSVATSPRAAGGNVYFSATRMDTLRLYCFATGDSTLDTLTSIPVNTFGLGPTPAVLGDSLLINFYYTENENSGVYATDLAAGTTELITRLFLVSVDPVPFGGALYFVAYREGFNDGEELWKTDGTAAGTGPVFPGNPAGMNAEGHSVTVAGDYLYFTSRTLPNNNLYRFRAGDTAPTLIATADPAVNYYDNLTYVGGDTLICSAGPDAGQLEPHLVTLDEPVLRQITDLNPGEGTSRPRHYFFYRGETYFSAYHPATGQELYRTDGTAAGTELLFDLLPGPGGSDPLPLAVFNGALYFRANDGVTGSELWRYDLDSPGKTGNPDAVVGLCSNLTSSHEATLTEPVMVYPNPASDVATVSLPEGAAFRLDVFAADGRRLAVLTGQRGTVSLSVNQYPAGTIMLRVTNETGRRRRTVPIAVQR